MDFEGFANLSWREALIAIVVLLAIYVLIVLFRIWRLKHQQAPQKAIDAFRVQQAVAAYAAADEPGILTSSDEVNAPEVPDASAVSEFPWNEPPGDKFSQKIEMIEREVEQLRKEVGGLRAQVMVLREGQQREIPPVRVTDAVSPLYSDAMQMALKGDDAGTISQHCGISRAEAELVVALVRNSET